MHIYFSFHLDLEISFTTSLRGRPAILANGIRYLLMSESAKKILWRCSFMATKSLKCPARITMLKEEPPKFIINKRNHVHAELKRAKYFCEIENSDSIIVPKKEYLHYQCNT